MATQFKYNVGDIVKTKSGRFGEIIDSYIVYDISFGPQEREQINEDEIITEPKVKRERKKKEKSEETK